VRTAIGSTSASTCKPLGDLLSMGLTHSLRLVDRDMFMRFRGGGVGHLYMRHIEPWLDRTGWGASWPLLSNRDPHPDQDPQQQESNRGEIDEEGEVSDDSDSDEDAEMGDAEEDVDEETELLDVSDDEDEVDEEDDELTRLPSDDESEKGEVENGEEGDYL
jgi:hypothetical protein